jgi:hypothetical protein
LLHGAFELRIADRRDLVGALLRVAPEVVDIGAGADVAELKRARVGSSHAAPVRVEGARRVRRKHRAARRGHPATGRLV